MKQNLHTHTIYCDGKNTPDELISAAIGHGFDSIGFSGHAHTMHDESYCMSREATKKYRKDINSLRTKYSDVNPDFNIYLGIEQDLFADPIEYQWDYIIGSVHYIIVGGAFVPIDVSREALAKAALDFYGGDIYGLTGDYYKAVTNIPQVTSCDIIGHFDLITKFNEDSVLFDEQHPAYVQAWTGALDQIFNAAEVGYFFGGFNRVGASLGSVPIFEINTGAIARGYRTKPYPSLDILKAIREREGRIIITSDCHDKDKIDESYDLCVKLAKEAGFGTQAYFDGSAFVDVEL